MAVLSKLVSEKAVLRISVQLAIFSLIFKIAQSLFGGKKRSKRSENIKLNRKFFVRLFYLLKICIPGIFTVEAGGTLLMSILLLLRTRLTLTFANIVGRNGKYLVERNVDAFIHGVTDLGLLSIPGTIIQAGIQYSKLMVQQRFRENIQRALQKKYLTDSNVYLMAAENTLDNPDHRITSDTRMFCAELTDFFRSVLKPLLDVITFSVVLYNNGTTEAPGFLVCYYLLVATFMSSVLPNFSYLVAKSQEKEGNLRTNHNQLVQHAEEVAFYGGESLEQEHSDKLLRSIVKHEHLIKKVKWLGGFMDTIFIKYGSTCIGYLVCGAAVARQKNKLSSADLIELYLKSTQVYIPLSQAIGKLLLLRKKIGALCSSTHRVGEIFESLDFLQSSAMKRENKNYIVDTESDKIVFSNVDVQTPTGFVLVKNFSLTIEKDQHTLIMGSNGSGKSALIRLLSGLWLVNNGMIHSPDPSKILFLSQRTYLPAGTLRSQLVYPMTEEEANAKVSEEDLLNFAALLGISYVIEREGGLDAINNWQDVLSGGEKQRVALIRVLTNKPIFAVLDECTSAVSQDDEPKLYAQLQKAGITLVTISHRDALKSIHDVLIELDGLGGYETTLLKESIHD